MKRNKVVIILSILVVLALVWFFFLRKKEQPLVLTTEKPETGYISTSVTATGTIQPVDTVTVGTQVSGTISELYTDFNATVKKGQLLAQLDKTLLQATVDQYNASLVQALSNQTYQAGNFNRQKQLYATGSISKADYDLAMNTYDVAKASVNNVKAQLKSAERNLSFTDIYSPIDGVVLSRSISVGQTVAASFNTPTLFVIAKDITKMQVQAKVDEADIGNVVKGQRATFTVDAFIDDTFTGSVEDIRLKPTTSANVVTYSTLIDAPNKDEKLKPGMTANIVIYTKEINDALLISAQALKFSPDSGLSKQYEIVPFKGLGKGAGHAGKSNPRVPKVTATDSTSKTTQKVSSYVWVLEGARLVQKQIKTGLNDNTHVQVLEGLSATDVVATGTQTAMDAKAAEQATASPFMPQRRGGKKR